MSISYWEKTQWLSDVTFTVVGSGIVGLNCALQLREKHPKAKILVLEKGIFPQGASTKNAGFACFGSASELLADLENHSENEVLALVEKRWRGLQQLRNLLGDKTIEFYNWKGYELFLKEHKTLFNECLEKKAYLNKLLYPIFKSEVYKVEKNTFGFKNIEEQYIVNVFEGQLNTGKLMDALLKLAQSKNITILNSCPVTSYEALSSKILVKTPNFTVTTEALFIATNGFAKQLNINNVAPARAQVLVTKPIPDLHIKGTFHLDRGYYYFRNIDSRILFGGGRNLDIEGETTTDFGETPLIQNSLENLLKTVILPNTPFEIDQRWSGIMGVGEQKKPILKQLQPNVFCGVRLGGMGVAIGTQVGKDLADLIN